MRISHESVYRAIYVRPRGELRRELRAHLRTGRSTRQRRNTRTPREARGQIVGAVSIHDRPEEIEERLIPGHYEGDLVVGPVHSRAAIGTLVERTSGHLSAFHLTEKTTAATIAGLTATLTRTGWPMKTLTWDRGKEMAGHAAFTIETGIQVYSPTPTHPWPAPSTTLRARSRGVRRVHGRRSARGAAARPRAARKATGRRGDTGSAWRPLPLYDGSC